MIVNKQRHFQLLEVMIAIAIVSLCAIPLIYPHVQMTYEQNVLKRELIYDHVANLVYADVLEQLYQNKINWNDITDHKSMPISSDLLSKQDVKGEGSFSFQTEYHKNEDANYLLKVYIQLKPMNEKPIDYEYSVFVKRNQAETTIGNKEKENEPEKI